MFGCNQIRAGTPYKKANPPVFNIQSIWPHMIHDGLHFCFLLFLRTGIYEHSAANMLGVQTMSLFDDN